MFNSVSSIYYDSWSRVIDWINPTIEKCRHFCQFFNEIFINDFSSVLRCIPNNCKYLIKDDWHGINPDQITLTTNHVAKVILLIPGADGTKPFTLYPLANKLNKENIPNVYTLRYKQTDADPIPTKHLEQKINAIAEQCFKQGAKTIDILTVGHSLGGVISVKYNWAQDPQYPISKIIAVASRIFYSKEDHPFNWHCQSLKSELEANFPKWQKNPDLAEIITIRGDRDGLVPSKSSHFQEALDKEHTVKGAGHLGIVYSDEAHNIIVDEIKKWIDVC